MASLLVIAAFVTLVAGVVAQPPKADIPPVGVKSLPAEDDKAIRKIVMGIEEAWNAHDMKAYGKPLQEDVEWINVVGMHWHGREAVVAAHTAFHATIFKNHSMKTDKIELRSLGNDHAIAVVTTTNDAFTTPDGHVMPKAQNRLTYVLVKGADGWKIAHAHNVVVDATAAKNNPVKDPRK